MEREFLLLIRISDQPGDDTDEEVGHVAVTGVLDMRNILELVIDGCCIDATLPH